MNNHQVYAMMYYRYQLLVNLFLTKNTTAGCLLIIGGLLDPAKFDDNSTDV